MEKVSINTIEKKKRLWKYGSKAVFRMQMPRSVYTLGESDIPNRRHMAYPIYRTIRMRAKVRALPALQTAKPSILSFSPSLV